MAKVLPSFMYGNPEAILDRKRASDAAQAKRKAERAARRSGLTQEDLKLIPADWLVKRGGGK